MLEMKKVFGDRLRRLRGSLSTTKMASVFGVGQTTWSSWENGAREPNIAMIYNICKHFNVSSDYLLGLSDAPSIYQAEEMKAAETPTKYKVKE